MRLRELELIRISQLSQPVNDRTARITESHHLRTLVKRLTHSIIDGLTENLVLKRTVHTHNLRISSGNEEAEIRELRLTVLRIILLDEIGENMSLKVIHLHKRLIQSHRKTLRKRSSHQQRSEQTRTACECNSCYIRSLDPCPSDGLAHNRHDIQLVSTRCKLRNHSAVSLMNILTGKHIGKQITVLDDCRRSVVA